MYRAIINKRMERFIEMFLHPTYLIDGDITDIDLDQLKNDGLKGIILDLDSTLIAPKAGVLTLEAEAWLTKARSQFKVAVVSNNTKADYVEKVATLLAMPVIGEACKPRRNGLRKALQLLDLKAEEAVLIGDRPLTDILGGQRAGMKTILVEPLKTMKELYIIRVLRKIERWCILA
jgi:HAD superfamily phosphatase (TIGR01668 family)